MAMLLAYNTLPFLYCTSNQPQSPAGMDIVEICCNAGEALGVRHGQGLSGWPSERRVEVQAGQRE